jgi:hypothetical protein
LMILTQIHKGRISLPSGLFFTYLAPRNHWSENQISLKLKRIP